MEHDGMDPLRAAPGADVVLAAVAGEPGVHVVGGAVRDALRGQVPRELDLVVEGDAVAVARRAAERVGGKLTAHERFGTATITADGFSFDLASSRRERYPRPGALPEVELGATLSEDLARRDFTVNAIAVSLADGALTAWPGAREDLDAGVLRILHDRSFIDDPTRMLRLVRYAARLDFAPDPATEALIDPALFATVTGDRLGNELRLLLNEPRTALQLLERYGLGRALLGDGFRVTWLAERAGTGLQALAACCTQVPRE
jgi:tRNA nucleotidyltransferase (CCA-adding enzyme)